MMKKALEILNNGIAFMTMHKDLNPQSREHLEAEIALYKEAIEELEGRNCGNCKYSTNGAFVGSLYCSNDLAIYYDDVELDSYCKHFEPKAPNENS